jgi:demethoxyubiquinone hydroxylase (CLK1/Coq7/Cat5 family)
MSNDSNIIKRLREFYILERFQVVYYKSQWSSTFDEYYRKAFEQMVYIESAHADYFAQKLREKNVAVPKVTSSLFEFASRILGESVEFTGPINTCKLGIALENKAMEMYKLFILEAWADQELRDTLMGYLLEEEFHTLWMKNYIKQHLH